MRVRIQVGGRQFELPAEPGECLLDVAGRAGVEIKTSCGGAGQCRSCRVQVSGGTVVEDGQEVLAELPVWVRSCHTMLRRGDLRVEIPARSLLDTGLATAYASPHLLFPGGLPVSSPLVSPDPDSGPCFGLAVDLGTTSVAGLLVDLKTGAVHGPASGWNRQLAVADNVLSRIAHASQSPECLRELQRLAVDGSINDVVRRLCQAAGIPAAAIRAAVIAGNTTMAHLAAGEEVDSIGQFPFTPKYLQIPTKTAAELGLAIAPAAPVWMPPALSGYLGGDVAAGLLDIGLDTLPGNRLFLDIGTNAEMVFRRKDGVEFACSVPAGPALEGCGLQCGSRAVPGTATRVFPEGDASWRLSVLGGGQPQSLSASAYVDFVALARRRGWISEFGRFEATVPEVRPLSGPGSEPAVFLAEALVVTEADIARILQAKAAIQSGIAVLLEVAGVRPEALTEVILAGALGEHLDLEAAVAIGMLPDLPRSQFRRVGNSSLRGAARCLVDANAARSLGDRIHPVRIVELKVQPSFNDGYVDALALP